MGLLRSETMKYGTLVLPSQDAHKYINLIGKTTTLQFEDMNAKEMRRPYRKYIQRLDDMERILRFLHEEIVANGSSTADIIKFNMDSFLEVDGFYKLDAVEAELQAKYKEFVKLKQNNETMTAEFNTLTEQAYVIKTALKLFAGTGSTGSASLSAPLMGDDVLDRRLGSIAGVLSQADEYRFNTAIWRASRGNAYAQLEPIPEELKDPKTGKPVSKTVFVIYFQGTGSKSAMYQKILKVCQAFGVNIYDWPDNAGLAVEADASLARSLLEKQKALVAFRSYMLGEVKDLLAPPRDGANSRIEEWRLFCIKEKSIYHVMNMCAGDILLTVNVWFPEDEEVNIHKLLHDANTGAQQGAMLMPCAGGSNPPTYVRVNDFTQLWQELVDTIGVPNYKEANPGLLTVVTFPFIFGMMYGDIGHGAMLLSVGLYLIFAGDSLKYTVPAAYQVRYLVAQLGFFAVFAGALYNDFFSLGIGEPLGFESRFTCNKTTGECEIAANFDIENTGDPDKMGAYPFGLDWMWIGATNELLFVNSLKMKLSVLFGVLQMFVGLCLRVSNTLYFKSKTDFFFECVPMLIFMICFFGWMDFMILYKWTHPIDDAPSIINSLICMTMGVMGQVDENPMWDGSTDLAQRMMAAAALAVPFLLFPKPFILLYQHNQAQKKKAEQGNVVDMEEAFEGGDHGHGHGEFEFGEVFIHQVIETIEYALGTVSHTASYLRIWALSLAHQQLSAVFYEKSMGPVMAMTSSGTILQGVLLYIAFAVWFYITVAVLLGMDVLECFLHTLRLHWVEFQSKFYKGEGYAFTPYKIQALLDPNNE